MKLFIVFILLFSLALFAQKPAGTLPVELVYFEGSFTDGKVILFWGTATEINNVGFEVERRMPQTTWITTGFVSGSGTSYSPKNYFFEDSTDLQSSVYFYRLKQIDTDGKNKYSDSIPISTITQLKSEVQPPSGFSLKQNFPNPFNPSTVISYRLSVNSKVSLIIYDLIGNKVAILVDEEQSAGDHSVKFDATSHLQLTTHTLPSGVYFYQLRAGNFVETKKLVIAK
ncbi:MAG: T9SS type A sorting domain-containing protein [Ignavibacteriaceae bacterium]|jgi:hypothetical protein